jgi:hypothetical protein
MISGKERHVKAAEGVDSRINVLGRRNLNTKYKKNALVYFFTTIILEALTKMFFKTFSYFLFRSLEKFS